jgi:hypothetical protein
MWPLSKAAEVLLKQIKAPQGDIENTVASLQLVRNVMGDFRDPSGHWKGVMSEVTALLAEMRNGPKKRKLGRNGDDGNLFLGLVSCQFMNWKSVIAGLKGVSGFFGVSIRRIIPSKRVAILNRLLLHRIPFWQLQRKSNPKVIFVALGM